MSDEEYADILRNVLLSQPCLNGTPGQPSLLINGLYIGSQRNAESYPTLERLGVTHVLNCAGYKGRRSYEGSPYYGLGIEYMEFMADDSDHYDITQHFREAFGFIERARKGGGVVLVHCALGINRSGATCLGYLMLMCGMKIIKAAFLIKSKRRVVLSNVGFQKRLVRLARKNGLLDDLDSAYVRTYANPKPTNKRRSNSIAPNYRVGQFFEEIPLQFSGLSGTADFKTPFLNNQDQILSYKSELPFYGLLKERGFQSNHLPEELSLKRQQEDDCLYNRLLYPLGQVNFLSLTDLL